ncbi:MAG: Lytic transglycosylase catalytic [Frankiales bacterium]|nr:Lytic transglycosylase catalytic [Frankiales bacterium]
MRLPALALVVLATTGAAVVAGCGLPASKATSPHAVSAPSPIPRVLKAQPASRSRTPVKVRPLRHVVTPDLMLTTRAPLTQAQVARILGLRGVTSSTVISTGAVRVGKRAVNAMGVDPSSFRAFTPRETARSDALWAAVAKGDLAASYAAKLPLGSTVHLFSRKGVDARIGAVASYDLPGSALVMDRVRSRDVGLVTNTILLAAPDRRLSRLENEVRALVGDKVVFTELRPAKIVDRRPKTYRELYQLSASYCPGLSWKVLAAIGQVESDHGRNVGPSSAGALGPMQFMPATWAEYAVDGDGDGKADIMNPYDAVPAAALYLCRNGAGLGGQALYDAIFNYNHADWYVREVLAIAAAYR